MNRRMAMATSARMAGEGPGDGSAESIIATFRRKISDFGIVADGARKASPAGSCRQGLFEGLIG